MGHVLTSDGLKPDPDKIKAVGDMPKPTTKQETQSLLGFVIYLSKFLPKLSEVAKPLRNLTVKNAPFMWSPQHDKSVNKVKQLVLQHERRSDNTMRRERERTGRCVVTKRTASGFCIADTREDRTKLRTD